MPSDRTPQLCPACGNTVNIRDYEYHDLPMVLCDGTDEHEGCDFATNAEAWNKLSQMRRERDALHDLIGAQTVSKQLRSFRVSPHRRQYDPHGSY